MSGALKPQGDVQRNRFARGLARVAGWPLGVSRTMAREADSACIQNASALGMRKVLCAQGQSLGEFLLGNDAIFGDSIHC